MGFLAEAGVVSRGFDVCLGAIGHSRQLAGDPLGQDQGVGGDLLVGVVAGEVDVVGGVGVYVGVDAAGHGLHVEGRGA